ncbi:uncharacterized protein Z518_07988 [Rhinocladiella mackenziei CBS 650.93]|uniref:Uncharacterized protein n=1 Tax=Rhinocladiella mackenziei CBS 650.93 TaxID=1442369 RepID=A0A0D2I882_9EURO|nr:uncharacterized protein Z518_07988 [Rhinocladiella mackenziei CBS 650.93]KIX02049.1 hypothetical protein Z518_07988 [Rhinocladiella mackenziei CBS 650.93]
MTNVITVSHTPLDIVHPGGADSMGSELRDSLKTGNRSALRPPFSLSKPERKATTSTTTAQRKTTTLSRGRRRDHSACPQFSADKIKETDPYRVELLWREVMAPKNPSYLRPTKSSQVRNEARLNKPNPSPENPTTDEDPAGSFTAPTSITATSRKQSVKTATVRDVDFEHTQLIPRGVDMNRDTDVSLGSVAGAYAYFRSEPPSNLAESCEFYRSIVQKSLAGRVERDVDDSIFPAMGAGFVESVHTAYRSLGEAGLPEPEFKAYALQNLFIGQYGLLADDTRRQLCAVRSVEWSLKPREYHESRLWRAPPILSPNSPPSKRFVFDIYPDCQFWLCDKIINPDYRASIRHVVYREALATFCPYFSIEFKATTDDTRTVENQVAAAGLISLFNRYHLKLDANPHPTPEQWKLVRHYGLTMEKENWTVWLFEPKIANEAWAGCKIQKLDDGTCKAGSEVRGLLSWINEIHRWGLCEYAPGCEDDIKHILGSEFDEGGS